MTTEEITAWKKNFPNILEKARSKANRRYPSILEIDDEKYYSVSAEDKTNCEDCDIFKDKKPISMIDVPLCYSYSLNNHKIVDYCRSKRIIWKRAK